jgi:hypothetical protein
MATDSADNRNTWHARNVDGESDTHIGVQTHGYDFVWVMGGT